ASPVTRMVIDNQGNVSVGQDALADGQLNVSGNPAFFKVNRFQAGPLSANIYLRKSRNATVGNHTIVQNGDALGTINFQGSDGSNYVTAAAIVGVVDGTPGTNDMPGRLILATTADGQGAATERVRVDSQGNVSIGGFAPQGR